MEMLLTVVVVVLAVLIVFFATVRWFPKEFAGALDRLTTVSIKDWLVIEMTAKTVKEREGEAADTKPAEELIATIPPEGRILWVDDVPANNRGEIQVLRLRGITVDTATTNKEALSYAKREPYDVVVSDIGRNGGEQGNAGLELPRLLREAGSSTPVAFYVETVDKPMTDDDHPVFNIPTELYRWIGKKLSGRSA
jgi:CheY-like chemotaxis protein